MQYMTTRLLIAERSENVAHELDSSLRDAGIATKLSISDDLAHIAQVIADGETDIAILTDKIEGLDKFLPRIHANAPHVPLVLLTEEDTPWSVSSALSAGAVDLVPNGALDQLALVVQRELEHIYQRNHTSELRRALKEAEQRCQLLLQGSQAAIAYVHEGMHIHANQGYLSLFGYGDVDELGTASLVDLLSADDAETLKGSLKRLRNGEDEADFIFTSNTDPSFRGHMSLTHAQYEGETCLQITVRKKENDTETVAVVPAPQTASKTAEPELGLPGFVAAAETVLSQHTGPAHILCMTVDNYAEAQSLHGLLGAESIARRVWLELTELINDYPAVRLSPSQFALAVPGDKTQVEALAQQMRARIAEQIFEVQDRTVHPSVSTAGCLFDAEAGVGGSLDEAFSLLQKTIADTPNNAINIVMPQAEDDVETSETKSALQQITHAIENKMFVLLFQPVISLRGDSDEHYEVFLRMLNDEGEQIEPGEFLQTAIDNRVAGKIDRWVILQAIKMLSVHRAKGNTTRLTINLTSNSMLDKDFPQWLSVAIKAARLPSDAVIFQLAEPDAASYLRQSREFVEKLRNMHCRASLSRFGQSENSFETLQHLPVDMVKIDGGCVAALDQDEDKRSELMSNITKLQGLGKLTVVPMVENANILSTLWQAGANYIQGHYLQEPSADMNYDFSTEE